jgi:hypothetical protein
MLIKREQNKALLFKVRGGYLSEFSGKTQISRKTAFSATLKKMYFLLPFDACQQNQNINDAGLLVHYSPLNKMKL